MGGGCGFSDGYTTEVIDVVEKGQTLPVELPSYDAGYV